MQRVQQWGDEEGFVAAGRLELPRERKPRPGADCEMQLVPVEAAALPRRDSGAMPPRGVGVGVGLPLGAVVVEEPLAVRLGTQIACIT